MSVITADTRTPETTRTPVTAPAVPSVHRRALLTWLAVYGAITGAQFLLGDLVGPLPVPLRTLVLTAVVVPLVVYVLVPALLRLNAAAVRRHRGHR